MPEFLVPTWAASSGGNSFLAIVRFVVIAITFAIVTTWVFNNTKGSVFMAILVHTSIDMFPIGAVASSPWAAGNSVLLSFGVLALVLIVLTRGRLGYDRYRQEEPYLATAPTQG
jgi:predicted lysophospholipase L1 biosynthesis ABC-type transport system permease subunit